jgi:hypothetical protein
MADAKSPKVPSKKTRVSKRSKKEVAYYPVQTDLLFEQAASGGFDILRADYALSGLNRRLYRQNKVYRVKIDVTGEKAQKLDVFRLRNTFMLQRGYELAMQEWNKSYEEAAQVVKENVRARWRDFRIDVTPHVNDVNALPRNLRSSGQGADLIPVVIDQFSTSLSYTPSGASRDFGIKSDANTFDIITEYNKVGKVQDSPTGTTTEAAYEELQTDLNDNMVARLQSEGNNPPYDADDHHPLDVLEYVGTIYIDADGATKSTTGFFDAPLGVVYVRGSVGAIDSIDQGRTNLFKMTVQKGQYKGVAAHDFVTPMKLE